MSIAPDLVRPSRRLAVAAAVMGLLVLGAQPTLSVESGSPVSTAPAADVPRPPAEIPAAAAPTPAAPSAPVTGPKPVATPAPTAPAARPPAAAPPARPAITTAAPAQGSINDDTARYLAGLPPAPGSPIAALTREDGWREHARFFDRAFAELDRTQLSRIRAWSQTQLHARHTTMFYMLSGPDYLYADAFFPDASTYVLAGLEPVGQIPDLLRTPPGSLGPALHSMAKSMHTVLNFSFFKTHDMREELAAGRFGGTTPILLVFLARSGKIVQEISLVDLDREGVEHPATDRIKSTSHGVKIVFSNNDGRLQTLYYFSTNLADDGFPRSGFMKFCEKLAPGDSLLKSASYLMHGRGFTKVRDFLIGRSATLLEDDSGIPLAYFDRSRWELRPFGRYLQPLGIFPNTYQPKLAELFHTNSTPINFGIGYRWRPNESNLLLAVSQGARTSTSAVQP